MLGGQESGFSIVGGCFKNNSARVGADYYRFLINQVVFFPVL
jgi:hypothetical protein